ncbi:hypothetical protein PCASD_23012 [Puccinia coronata f. sp. avenae]|uniref:Uncharacterized protein n=1 Tax=Puccinia coronata f. sp. avenae TaxID=200324 RepID=A0A2N5TN17_9BASI|nr:hypothetical protein PCASD_23012 [Puccinia coronata f. sp. avenae]
MCKFRNKKSRAYHKYTMLPFFLEYTAEELYHLVTDAQIWRWDWAKTTRQSQKNMNFVKGIRKVIAQEAADPTQPIHTQVPASDWLYLDNAINSAYPNIFVQRLGDADLRLANKPVLMMARSGSAPPPVSNGSNNNNKEHGKEDNRKGPVNKLSLAAAAQEARWDNALDIKYMSSKDKANVHNFSSLVPVGSEKPDNTLAALDKVFAICCPTWRSSKLHTLFAVPNPIKQPKQAYFCVLGPV